MRWVRQLFFLISKYCGLFHLTSLLYRRRLNILCYHGFSIHDAHKFRPSTFTTQDPFAKRLAWLKKHKFIVLGLEEALNRLKNGTLRRKTVVITVDDGFYGFYKLAVPLLKMYRYPATCYITTYYVLNQNPIFSLAIQYMFWKTRIEILEINDVLPLSKGKHPTKGQGGHEFMWQIIYYAEQKLTEIERVNLAIELGKRLSVDYEELRKSRELNLVNIEEIKQLVKDGIDVQLHTHRHRLPKNQEGLRREIAENRAVLEPLVGKPLEHLCYPSGIWDMKQWKPLARIGVRTATTCRVGLNTQNTPLLGLYRCFDQDGQSKIEFDAELYGFKELLRSLLNIASTHKKIHLEHHETNIC